MKSDYYKKTKMSVPLEIQYIYSFHLFEYVKDFQGIGESHDFWEFVYIDYGTVRVISDRDEYTLSAGEGFLHRPGEFHNLVSEGDYACAIIVSFDCSCRELDILCRKKLRLYGEARTVMNYFFKAGRAVFEVPLDIFDQQKVRLQQDIPFGEQQLTVRYLEAMFILLIQSEQGVSQSSRARRSAGELDSSVDKVVEILQKYLYSRVSMETVCRETGYSVSYLSRIFKKTMNMGVMDYYNHLKIQEAKRMISEGGYTFAQIAEKLDYSSVHYFSRVFKQMTNMTPGGYRSSVRGKGTL